MTLKLYAKSSNPEQVSFYFKSWDEWQNAYPNINDHDGHHTAEFKIECVEGNSLDQEFAKAWRITSETVEPFFAAINTWDAEAKTSFIIAVKHHAKRFDPLTVNPDSFDMCLYFVKSHHELASYFVEHDVLGEVPMVMKAYIDIEKFANDLTREYIKTQIAGETVIYRFNEGGVS
jgi:hypothetical protein